MKPKPLFKFEVLEEGSNYWLISLVLFFVLFLKLNSFGITANEEFYFQVAHRRVEPELYGMFHAVFDFSNARFLFEFLLGNLIAWFGFDLAHSICRTLAAALFALSIGYFLKPLELSALAGAAICALFILFDEQIVGKEWLFLGFESKIPAYICVFFALGAAARQKYGISIALAVLSTYFHFLVGGFWVLALFGLFLMDGIDKKRILHLFIAYCALVLPLVAIIAIEQFNAAIPVDYSGLPPESIFQIRVSHHIAPFQSTSVFLSTWVPKILVCLLMLVMLCRIRKIDKDFALVPLTIGLLGYFFIAIVLSYFDRSSNLVGKFFLFRPTSLTLFLFITICVYYLLTSTDRISASFVKFGLTAIVAYFVVQHLFVFTKQLISEPPQPIAGYTEIIDSIKSITGVNDVVLIEPYNEMQDSYASLPRLLKRQTLVSWKFNPTLPADLVEWFDRFNFKKAIFSKGCTESLRYKSDYLLVLSAGPKKATSCGEVVWVNSKNSAVKLIRIDDRWKS